MNDLMKKIAIHHAFTQVSFVYERFSLLRSTYQVKKKSFANDSIKKVYNHKLHFMSSFVNDLIFPSELLEKVVDEQKFCQSCVNISLFRSQTIWFSKASFQISKNKSFPKDLMKVDFQLAMHLHPLISFANDSVVQSELSEFKKWVIVERFNEKKFIIYHKYLYSLTSFRNDSCVGILINEGKGEVYWSRFNLITPQ